MIRKISYETQYERNYILSKKIAASLSKTGAYFWIKNPEYKKIIIPLNNKLLLYYYYIYIYILKHKYISNINPYNNKVIILTQQTLFNLKKNINFLYNLTLLILSVGDMLFIKFLIKNKYFKYSFKNNNVLTHFEFFKNKMSVYKYNCKYFIKIKTIVYYYFKFKMRVQLGIFLHIRKYINYIKLVKYDEYIKVHPNLKNCNILKKLLCCRILKNNFKVHTIGLSWTKLNIYKDLFIYGGRAKYYRTKKDNKIWSLNKHTKEFNTFFFIKLIPLINNKFIFYPMNIYNIVYFYLQLNYILIFSNVDADWQELYEWRPTSIYNVYWQVKRYGFFIEWWMYTIICLNIMVMYKLKRHVLFIILKKKKKIKYNPNMVCWYLLKKFLLLNYLKELYFKFYFEFINIKRKFQVDTFKLIWYILMRFRFTYWSFLKYNDNKELFHYLLKNKLTIDLITWRIFYSGNIINLSYLNMNIYSYLNKYWIDKTLNKITLEHKHNILLYLNKLLFNKNYTDNHYSLLYIYLFNISSFIKSIFLNFCAQKFKKKNIYIFKTYKIYEQGLLNRMFNVWLSKENYYNFSFDNQKDMFDYNIEDNFLLQWVLIFIWRYNLNSKTIRKLIKKNSNSAKIALLFKRNKYCK